MFLLSILQMVEDAISALSEKYEKMMKNLAYSILKDVQLSEDAVQESLLKLSDNMDKIDNLDSDRSKNFIYTVTKNESISMIRKRKKIITQDVLFSDSDALNNIEGQLDVGAFCNKYGFSVRTEEALSKLNELDRDIIIYRFAEGYRIKEIAKLIGKTPDYVSKRLQRAIKKLQEIYGEDEDE